MTIKKMETGNAEILTDGENAARAGAKPQIKIYREYNIREQIAAGGAGDWQIRIRKYTVSRNLPACDLSAPTLGSHSIQG